MNMFLAAALTCAAMAVPAQASLMLDYQLNGSLADGLGGADIINNGGMLGPTGISFAANAGPMIGGFSTLGICSVVVEFSFAG